MNSFKTHLKTHEVELLKEMVGSTWYRYGGSTFVHDGRFALGQMHISSSVGTVSITSTLTECAMPTGPEDLALIGVHRGSDDCALAERRGCLFFHEKGQQIESISIVRAEVRVARANQDAFTISMDHCINFHFEDHDLSVSRGSWFMETLEVLRSSRQAPLRVDVRSVDWDSDLENQYEISYDVTDISRVD